MIETELLTFPLEGTNLQKYKLLTDCSGAAWFLPLPLQQRGWQPFQIIGQLPT